MVIGFNKQFKDAILSGEKKHTIREDKHNRWKPGMKMHMATGVRTKEYNQFYEAVCVSTQEIEIIRKSDRDRVNDTIVKVDGHMLTDIEILHLIVYDGFNSIAEFLKFFQNGFKGKIIHWTDLKY